MPNSLLNIPQKIYTIYSPSHELFKPWFESILNIYPKIKIEYSLIEQICASGINYDRGWTKATIYKLEKIIEFFNDEENIQEYFIFSDIDVQFFNSFHEEIYKKLQYYDIVFQDDKSSICTGFFACRKANKCKNFFIYVLNKLKEVEKNNPDSVINNADDQRMTQRCLELMPTIKYTKLSNKYFNFSHSVNFNPKVSILWEPSIDIILPCSISIHHANWTRGITNKVFLLEHVKAKMLALGKEKYN